MKTYVHPAVQRPKKVAEARSAVAALALALAAVSASANQFVFNSPVLGPNVGTWTGVTSVPKFDPTLGTLTQITFTIKGSISGDLALENLDAMPKTGTVGLSASIGIKRPDTGNFVEVAVPTVTQVINFTAFDGDGNPPFPPMPQFIGTDSAIISGLKGDASFTKVDTLAADLALFTGPGSINLTVASASKANNSASGNFASSTTVNSSAQFTIVYDFVPPLLQPKDTVYCANAAPLLAGAKSPALTLPGVATDLIFTPAAGGFTQHSDGTANLVGTLSSAAAPADGFVVSVTLTGPLVPVVNPNLIVAGADASGWRNYSGGFTGTLTGLGKFKNGVIGLLGTGFQIGKAGANLKNLTFGGSGAFGLAVITQPSTGYVLNPSGPGSFNLNFTGDGTTCVPDPTPCVAKGTATIGYWKNHPEAWPVDKITLGCTSYTKSQAICKILDVSPRGDLRITLAQQLIAAKLSVDPSQCNQTYCIVDDITAADGILCKYPVGGVTCTPKSLGTQITAIQTRLDDYNNGRLCAAHRN